MVLLIELDVRGRKRLNRTLARLERDCPYTLARLTRVTVFLVLREKQGTGSFFFLLCSLARFVKRKLIKYTNFLLNYSRRCKLVKRGYLRMFPSKNKFHTGPSPTPLEKKSYISASM